MFTGFDEFQEIHKESGEYKGKITSWSTKSDIWSLGAVLYYYLCSKMPRLDQPASLEERVAVMKKLLPQNSDSVPEMLIRLTCECLSPKPEDRPSALELLAVCLKCDVSPQGLLRSESFWKALADWTDENGPKTVRHFTNNYLRKINDATFSPVEACLLASLATLHVVGPSIVFAVGQGLRGALEGGSVLHALADLPAAEEQVFRLSWEVSKWPGSTAVVSLATMRTKTGLLPSAIAARRGNLEVASKLSRLE